VVVLLLPRLSTLQTVLAVRQARAWPSIMMPPLWFVRLQTQLMG
jgi:hypothetical protein